MYVYVPLNVHIGETESVVMPDIIQVAPQSGTDNSANLTLTALTTEQVSRRAKKSLTLE